MSFTLHDTNRGKKTCVDMEERRLLWWYKLNTLQAKWYAFSPWLQKAHVCPKVGTPDQVCKGPKSVFVVEQLRFHVKPHTHGRDSQFSRLGTETLRVSVQVSSRNRNRYRNPGLKGLGIGLGTKTQTFQVSESEPESKSSVSKNFPLIATPVLV